MQIHFDDTTDPLGYREHSSTRLRFRRLALKAAARMLIFFFLQMPWHLQFAMHIWKQSLFHLHPLGSSVDNQALDYIYTQAPPCVIILMKKMTSVSAHMYFRDGKRREECFASLYQHFLFFCCCCKQISPQQKYRKSDPSFLVPQDTARFCFSCKSRKCIHVVWGTC